MPKLSRFLIHLQDLLLSTFLEEDESVYKCPSDKSRKSEREAEGQEEPDSSPGHRFLERPITARLPSDNICTHKSLRACQLEWAMWICRNLPI